MKAQMINKKAGSSILYSIITFFISIPLIDVVIIEFVDIAVLNNFHPIPRTHRLRLSIRPILCTAFQILQCYVF